MFKVVAQFAVVFIVFGIGFLFGIKYIYSGSNKYEETNAYGGGSFDESPFTAAGTVIFNGPHIVHFVLTNVCVMATISVSDHFGVSV